MYDIEKITKKHKLKLCKSITITSNCHSMRTKRLTIAKYTFFDSIPMIEKYYYEHLTINCYSNDFAVSSTNPVKFNHSLKTLIIHSYDSMKIIIKMKMELPKSLKKLMIPDLWMDEYPNNLEYLVCCRFQMKHENYLPKLRKLFITSFYYKDTKLPKNIETLSMYGVPSEYPKNLKKMFIRTNDTIKISKLPESVKYIAVNDAIKIPETIKIEKLSLCLTSLKNYDIYDIIIDVKITSLKHLSLNVRSIMFDVSVPINLVFPKLESLSIKCHTCYKRFCYFRNNIKKLKIIVVSQDNHSDILITKLPVSLTYLSYEHLSYISQDFILPPNLIYLKMMTKSSGVYKIMQLPQSLKILKSDCHFIVPDDTFPPNLILMDIETNNNKLLSSMKCLTKLKYLTLKTNIDVSGYYPLSLKYLRKNYREYTDDHEMRYSDVYQNHHEMNHVPMRINYVELKQVHEKLIN